MKTESNQYKKLLSTTNTNIRNSNVKAMLSVNNTLLMLYWDTGKMIDECQQKEGWGSSIIPKLSKDIRKKYPNIKGFSVRNLQRMIRFYKEYSTIDTKVPQVVAQLPWGHNILLIEKVKKISKRFWYMKEAIKEGWSRNKLEMMIKNDLYKQKGESSFFITKNLPPANSDIEREILNNQYSNNFFHIYKDFK